MKIKKRLTVLTIAGLMFSVSITAAAVSANTKARCIGEGVAVRSQPVATSTRLGLMEKNENIYYNPSYIDFNANTDYRYVNRTVVSMNGWSHCDFLQTYNW